MVEFKKGQKLRRTEDAGLTTARVGEIYTFDEYEPGSGVRWLALAEFPAGVAGDRWPFSARAFELVEEEVKTETTTEEVEVTITALLPGDVVIRKADHPNYLAVRREVPARPEPGTFGTATVGDVRIRGFVAGLGTRAVFVGAKDGGYYTASGDAFPADFTPDAPPAPPAPPTREALAKAVKGGNEPTPNPFLASGVLVEVDPELAADRVLALLKEARP